MDVQIDMLGPNCMGSIKWVELERFVLRYEVHQVVFDITKARCLLCYDQFTSLGLRM